MATRSAKTQPGRTTYMVLRDVSDQPYNTSTLAFEAYTAGHRANYAIAGAEQGSTGYYVFALPAGLATGTYRYVMSIQAGGSVADGDPCFSSGSDYYNATTAAWTGVPVTPSGQLSTGVFLKR